MPKHDCIIFQKGKHQYTELRGMSCGSLVMPMELFVSLPLLLVCCVRLTAPQHNFALGLLVEIVVAFVLRGSGAWATRRT